MGGGGPSRQADVTGDERGGSKRAKRQSSRNRPYWSRLHERGSMNGNGTGWGMGDGWMEMGLGWDDCLWGEGGHGGNGKCSVQPRPGVVAVLAEPEPEPARNQSRGRQRTVVL